MAVIKRPFEAEINDSRTASDVVIQELKREKEEIISNDTSAGMVEDDTAVSDPEAKKLERRKKWADDYRVCSFYIDKKVVPHLNRKAKFLGKGGKTLVINDALTRYFIRELESEPDGSPTVGE